MIDYYLEKRNAKEKSRRTIRIYPPVYFSKRNEKSAFTIKIFDTEMMRDILKENFYLDEGGRGCLSIDFSFNPQTNRIYSYIPTESLQVVYGVENPYFYALSSEQRNKILNERKKG